MGEVVDLLVNSHGVQDGRKFVREVWREQPKGFFLVRTRNLEGKWLARWFSDFNEVAHAKLPKQCDIYFSPVAFSKPRALKENVLPSRWLFADLDYLHPTEAPFTPDVAWETSPGKWQALWYLTHHVEPEEFRHLNRALCHATGADPGTWNTNRLLRVPGTENMKAYRRAA